MIRLIANDALHDRDIHGLERAAVREMVRFLSQAGEVLISSQGNSTLSSKSIRSAHRFEDIHAVLAGAQFFMGESPTMAVESSLLGTPAYLISGRIGRLGNMICLERNSIF